MTSNRRSQQGAIQMEEIERLLCVAYFLRESLHWSPETETVKGFLTRVHQLGTLRSVPAKS